MLREKNDASPNQQKTTNLTPVTKSDKSKLSGEKFRISVMKGGPYIGAPLWVVRQCLVDDVIPLILHFKAEIRELSAQIETLAQDDPKKAHKLEDLTCTNFYLQLFEISKEQHKLMLHVSNTP